AQIRGPDERGRVIWD
nr:EJd=low Mr zona pellucida binding protein {N-terminal} [swine, pH3 extract of ejaculated spermatozoa, Peptide Partial, 15 aa] [Sus scrofa]